MRSQEEVWGQDIFSSFWKCESEEGPSSFKLLRHVAVGFFISASSRYFSNKSKKSDSHKKKKKSEIMPFAAMWVDLAMLTLSEGSWTKKDV